MSDTKLGSLSLGGGASSATSRQPPPSAEAKTSHSNQSEDDFSEIRGGEDEIKEKATSSSSPERRPASGESDHQDSKTSHQQQPLSAYEEYQREPAHVDPIPKIPPIPPVSGLDDYDEENNNDKTTSVPASYRPKIPQWVTASLIGKRVDEYGDVVDDDGRVLGRVAGDLPSMVGRTVLNQRGDILGDDGELLGYVAEVARPKGKKGGPQPPTTVESGRDDDGGEDAGAQADDAAAEEEDSEEEEEERPPSPTSMDQFLGETGTSAAGLRVDHRGNILDSFGNIVGHFRDNIANPKTAKEQARERKREEAAAAAATGGGSRSGGGGGRPSRPRTGPGGGPLHEPPPDLPREHLRATGDGPNAASWRKENESPSDIFMDVKSTSEGIQLTIRIPTVFPGQGQCGNCQGQGQHHHQYQPRVNFSTS